MISLRCASLAALLPLFVGCASPNDHTAPPPPCVSDNDCESGQLCFAEGCGDLGTLIVAEVSGDAASAQLTQDFAVDTTTLGSESHFDLSAPLGIVGEFQRELSSEVDPTNRTFYSESVLVRAIGRSTLIPGAIRSYEQRFERPERGVFQMNVGSGVYRVTATPSDIALPAQSVHDLRVDQLSPMGAVSFAFPSIEGLIRLKGRLLMSIDTAVAPALEVPITESAFDLQAIDPTTNEPLSQRFQVSSGQPGSSGDFSMTLDPRVKTLKSIQLVATPRDLSLPFPSKTFSIATPLPANVTLELGNFGKAESVEVRVVASNDSPVAHAQLWIEGSTVGGGSFRSRIVSTSENGVAQISTLKQAEGSSLTLSVVPAPDDQAAAGQFSVHLESRDGRWVIDRSIVQLGDRTHVTGRISLPSMAPAASVRVRATELEPKRESRLPLEAVETTTDAGGVFELRLDRGQWRIDVLPAESYAAVSRSIVIDAMTQVDASTGDLGMLPLVLSPGRRVSGMIRSPNGAVAHARVRFFRVQNDGAKPTAILLGATVADKRGYYQLSLPSRSE